MDNENPLTDTGHRLVCSWTGPGALTARVRVEIALRGSDRDLLAGHFDGLDDAVEFAARWCVDRGFVPRSDPSDVFRLEHSDHESGDRILMIRVMT